MQPKKILISMTMVASSLLGCAADTGAPLEEPSVEADAQNLLAKVVLDDGREVSFYDQGKGFTIYESVSAGETDWAITEDMRGLTLLEIYQRVAPAQLAAPQRIVEADQRYRAAAETASENPVELARPTLEPGSAGEGPALYTDAEQAWFRSAYCTSRYLAECIQGWEWAGSNWVYGKWFQTYGYANTGAQASTLKVYWWNGSQAVQVGSTYLGSNQVGRLTVSWTAASYWRSTLDNVGPYQLSLSTEIAASVPVVKGGR